MAEKDYSVMVAALVAVVAIVGLVVQFSGGSTGMLPADYGAAYRHTYPTIERGSCPAGYTETDTVCTGSVIYENDEQRLCYRTADLYCVKNTQPLGNSQAPRELFNKETRFVAHEEDCILTPPDVEGTSYYLC